MTKKFVYDLNLTLLEFEHRARGKGYRTHEPKVKFEFVIGAPRSGTTVATQCVASYHDYGYITNIAARFPLAPVTGIKLSEEIVGKKPNPPTMRSSHARTSEPANINEFGWFWQHHLDFKNSQAVDDVLDPLSQELTRNALLAMSYHFGRPIVMKGIYPAYVSKYIERMLGEENVIWNHITRNPLDCCISIWKARKARFRDKSRWFGWYPLPEAYLWMKKLPPREQVAAQVGYFRLMYAEIATITTPLRELCEDYHLSLHEYSEDERDEWRDIYAKAGHASAEFLTLDRALSQVDVL